MPLYPAEVASVDREKRRVKFKIVGMTDGARDLPEAEIMYGMGDRPSNSEVEIIQGDLVWIDFMLGDQNYPVIMGFRNKSTNNIIEKRKWHHENIELNADNNITLKGNTLTLDFSTITVKGQSTFEDISTFQSTSNMDGGLATTEGAPVTSNGGMSFKGGQVTHNGTNIGNDHGHQDSTGGMTGPPK